MIDSFDDFGIRGNVKTPKYRQLMNIIMSDIESGVYKEGEKLPSVTDLSINYLLARDTVEKAYKKLKAAGIITSTPCLGYFVTNSYITTKTKICLCFNKLSNYKLKIYYSFIQTLKQDAIVDIKIYNYNLVVFENIINENLDKYDYFVIIPHFLPGTKGISDVIKRIPKEKVLILDQKVSGLEDTYTTIHQDYKQDIIQALFNGSELLSKYDCLNLVFPHDLFYASQIIDGFKTFCETNRLKFSIIQQLTAESLKKNQAYIITRDQDLVTCINICNANNFILGRDIGLIAYNEDPIKEIIADGITTISTNHEQIGTEAARQILGKEFKEVKIPFSLIIRKSL